MDGRRVDRRGFRLRGQGALRVVRGRELPDPDVHGQAARAAGDGRHPAHRLGPLGPAGPGPGIRIPGGPRRRGGGPSAGGVRSWELATGGGLGGGPWSGGGERGVVKQTGVRPEGPAASATNILSRERADLVRWTSTDRVIGDESVPDDEGY